MRLSCCVQALWYDEGDKLKDTRSGSCEANDEYWDDYHNNSQIALDAADMLQVREATSAQVDLTRIGADHVLWNKNSAMWSDFAKLNSKEALINTRTRPCVLYDHTVLPCSVVCLARVRVHVVAVRRDTRRIQTSSAIL